MVEEMKQCCACRHKETERADELQRDLTKRLNRAIGQLNGVKEMIADNMIPATENGRPGRR